MDSMNLEDDEFEELNILGMHSPIDHDMPSSLHGSSEDEEDEEDDEDGSDDEDDEDMTNDSASEEGDGVDPMEIQGHW